MRGLSSSDSTSRRTTVSWARMCPSSPGPRCNASVRSHAELDEAEELDEGNPGELAAGVAGLRSRLPNVSIVGGCCGTDARHVASMWNVELPVPV